MSERATPPQEEYPSPAVQGDNHGTSAPRSVFQEWLEKLQQESWQLELVISGLALYLIWEARSKLDQLDSFIALLEAQEEIGILLDLLQYLAWGAWAIFIINLLAHIALRGLWIGAIGLRYVSGDIDFRHLNYSDRFESFLSRRVGRFDAFIEKLERACSVIFAYTFLLFFLFLSLLMTLLVPIGVISSLENYVEDSASAAMWIGSMVFFYLILGFIYLIDFLTLGGIKKIKDKTVSAVYFYIYLFFSLITLSFLYRPLLYNFLDNRYSRRLLWLSIPYFTIAFLLAPLLRINTYAYFPLRHADQANDFENTRHDRWVVNWANYEDLRKEFLKNNTRLPAESRIIRTATLDRYVLDGEEGWLFLRIHAEDDQYLEKIVKLPKLWKTGLRHPLMLKGDREKDTVQVNHLAPYDNALTKLRKEKRKDPDKYAEARWQAMFDSLDDLIARVDREYSRNNERTILQTYRDIYEVSIDSVAYNDSLHCRYYMHPNMGEKGLLCRLPLSGLAPGDHVLELKRKVYDETRDKPARDTFRSKDEGLIPFLKR